MQMEKGREMLLLARLRSELEELELDLEDFLEDEGAARTGGRCPESDYQYVVSNDLRRIRRKRMSEKHVTFEYCDQMVADFEKAIKHPIREKSSVYYTGVDLGTACVVIAVLDENRRPVAGAYRYADVVRDGMVVDYIGAVQIVRELKEEIEEKLGTELIYAAGAIPPGTDLLDSGAVKNVIQGAGFELTNLLDESTAANEVLKMKNGAVVDIGGGHDGNFRFERRESRVYSGRANREERIFLW